MGGASAAIRNTGTPSSSVVAATLNPRRARSDSARPRLLPLRAARARATASTSSSIRHRRTHDSTITSLHQTVNQHRRRRPSVAASPPARARSLRAVFPAALRDSVRRRTGASLRNDRDVASRPLPRTTPPDLVPCAERSSSQSSFPPPPWRWASRSTRSGCSSCRSRRPSDGRAPRSAPRSPSPAVGGLSAPLLGRAMDRFGARPIIVLSLAVFGFELLPSTPDVGVVALVRAELPSVRNVLRHDGAAPAGRLVAAWYPHIRGRMTGVAATGNNVGGLVMPLAVAALLAAMPWSEASLAIGLASFAVAGAALVVIREAPPAGGAGRRRPGSTGERKIRVGSAAPGPGPARNGAYRNVLCGARRHHPGDVHLQHDSSACARAHGEQGHGERLGAVRTRYPRRRRASAASSSSGGCRNVSPPDAC